MSTTLANITLFVIKNQLELVKIFNNIRFKQQYKKTKKLELNQWIEIDADYFFIYSKLCLKNMH